MKEGFIPKRLTLPQIEQAFRMVYKLMGKAELGDLPDMTLAQLNGKITDADLDDENEQREPTAHSTTHEPEGTDDLIGRIVLADNTDNSIIVRDDNESIMMWDK